MPTPSASGEAEAPPRPAIYGTSSRFVCPPEERHLGPAVVQRNVSTAQQDAVPAQDVEGQSTDGQLHGDAAPRTPTSPTSPQCADNPEDSYISDLLSPTSSIDDAPEGFHHSATRASREYDDSEESLFPSADTRFLANSTSSFLRPGSKFHGEQKSNLARYDVQVEIQHVDMAESFMCGYLSIQGLTNSEHTLTTYFEGEIIGTKYTFQTKHANWGSNERVDMQHWDRFPAWRPISKQAKRSDFTFKNFAQRENIFMRWKERFLVPDHKRRTINGASYEGFYYICFNQVSGTISGMYYHHKTEGYQKLELQHVDDRGCLNVSEFR